MAISFPSNPTTNQTYTYGTQTWVFDGSSWMSSQTIVATGIIVSDTEPTGNFSLGASWFDTTANALSVYNGTAWVSAGLATNSVSTASIQNGAVTSVKLAAGAAVPTQTGQTGKYLTTDGTTASWATVNSLPTQASQSGKYLTTDGTNASWATVSTTPADGSITAAKLGLGTGYLPMAIGNTLQRPGTPASGYMRINSELNAVEVYYGNAWFTTQYIGYIIASGGAETTVGDYKIHTFTTSGTFLVSFAPANATIEYLVVAGGGGGGSNMGGGGGAGGVLALSGFGVTATGYAITVGAGGVGAPAGISQVSGTNGSNSSLGATVIATGGGGGASEYSNNNSPGKNGGSGGGTASYSSTTFGLGIVGQGNNGGPSGGQYFPGGGGGAGAAGSTNPANGGIGVQNSILGTSYYWGGGGGGSGYSGISGNGGMGGGGGGAPKVSGGGLAGTGGLNTGTDGAVGTLVAQTNVPGGNGATNTGGGGGGGAHYNSNNYGGTGGSGIVIVRYRYK